MPKEEEKLNDKDEVFTVKLTAWQQNALIQVIMNGNYVGKDIEGLSKLLQKLKDAKKEK